MDSRFRGNDARGEARALRSDGGIGSRHRLDVEAELDKRQAEVTTRLETAEARARGYEQELAEAAAKTRELEERKATLTSTKSDLQKRLAELQSRISHLETASREAAGRQTSNTSETESLEAEVAAAERREVILQEGLDSVTER